MKYKTERTSTRRLLTEDEKQLWRQVTKTIKPARDENADVKLHAALRGFLDARVEVEVPVKTASAENTLASHLRNNLVSTGPSARASKQAVRPAHASHTPSLDRKTKNKLSRMSTAIEDRLDLHGMRQEQAFAALKRFLSSSQQRGVRFVIVITGKGSATSENDLIFPEAGVLRTSVPRWLALPEFQPLVSGISEASRQHGGSGALYVRIRRIRDLAQRN